MNKRERRKRLQKRKFRKLINAEKQRAIPEIHFIAMETIAAMVLGNPKYNN